MPGRIKAILLVVILHLQQASPQNVDSLMFQSSKISDDIQIIKKYKLESQVPVFPEKMHQVIMNILDNAIFAVNMEVIRPKIITISTGLEVEKLILSFSNTGPRR